jgi:hypothetical protein
MHGVRMRCLHDLTKFESSTQGAATYIARASRDASSQGLLLNLPLPFHFCTRNTSHRSKQFRTVNMVGSKDLQPSTIGFGKVFYDNQFKKKPVRMPNYPKVGPPGICTRLEILTSKLFSLRISGKIHTKLMAGMACPKHNSRGENGNRHWSQHWAWL